MWLASSLAVYLNGPPWLAVAVALALCPVAPLAWELGFHRPDRSRAFQRICLRSLVLNVLFVGGVLALRPADSFAALTTRGDWMLEGARGPEAERARGALLALADGLEWLYLASREQPYGELARLTPAPPPPAERARRQGWRPPAPPAGREPDGPPPGAVAVGEYTVDGQTIVVYERPGARPPPPPRQEDPARPAPSALRAGDPLSWPLPSALHPAVAALPAFREESIAQVASALSAAEPDPVQRVKALHDYVADRVTYDLQSEQQDAESVFRARKAVCAGYARLFDALAKAAGLTSAIVVGVGKSGEGQETVAHAWNAVKLDGGWHLLDVTWDSGAVVDGAYVKRYRSDFLLTPPAIFARTHLPEDPGWQLLDQPLTRGEFWRQVDLRPAFYASGLRLLGEERSQIDAQGSVQLEVSNPQVVPLFATAALGTGAAQGCSTELGPRTRITCQLSRAGTYRLRLFGGQPSPGFEPSPTGTRRYDQLASLDVNNRG